MIVCVIGSPCYHAQEVLLGCFDTSDAKPYARETVRRSKCRYCHKALVEVILHVVPDDDSKSTGCPFSIDVAAIDDNELNAQLHRELKDACDALPEVATKHTSSSFLAVSERVSEKYREILKGDPRNANLKRDYAFLLQQVGKHFSNWHQHSTARDFLNSAHGTYLGLWETHRDVEARRNASEVARLIALLPS